MSVPVTVTTASIPGREELLAEAIRSVNAQTVVPEAHLIRVQEPPDGLSPVHLSSQRNALLAGVQTDWLAILDDDDVYLPHHFATIEAVRPWDRDVDVIYTFARQGRERLARDDVTDWSADQLIARLELGNCIPSNSAIRVEAVRHIGGWDERTYKHGHFASGATWDDWDLWLRLARAGAKFSCIPIETWDYRSGDWQRCVA